MKRIHILLAGFAIAFTGCATYQSAQTPDDIYYSPGAVQEPVTMGEPVNNQNGDYYSVPNDQYIHLKAQDPAKWSYFDDYNTDYYAGYPGVYPYYGYGPYTTFGMGFGYGPYGFGMAPWIGFSYWDPMSYMGCYYSWNSFYNPYYGGVIVVNPKLSSYNYFVKTSTFNPSSYTNMTYNRMNVNAGKTSYTPYSYSQTIRPSYVTANGASFRNYSPGQQNVRYGGFRNFSGNTQPTRTFSAPSFGGSSSGGFRSGGGGGFSRPGR